MSNFELVKEFHEKFGCTIQDKPKFPEPKDCHLRFNLIHEEFEELKEAYNNNDIVEVADAIADMLYVTYGFAATFGLDADKLFKEVHRSNMSKVWSDGTVRYREEDGKILKPPTYSPADIKGVLFASNSN